MQIAQDLYKPINKTESVTPHDIIQTKRTPVKSDEKGVTIKKIETYSQGTLRARTATSVIFTSPVEYISVNAVNDISAEKKSSTKKAGAIMLISPFFSESYALAKEQVQNDALKDAKAVGGFALLSNLFVSSFNISFLIILLLIFGMALIEYLFSLMKRFRLPGVDYAPMAKTQILLGSFIVFVAASFLQVGVDYITATQLPKSLPGWLEVAKDYANIRNATALFVLGFYMNTVRKMFSKAAGAEEPVNENPVSGNPPA